MSASHSQNQTPAGVSRWPLAKAFSVGAVLVGAIALIAWQGVERGVPEAAAASAQGHAMPAMTVYKSPTCGCCTKWVEYLQKAGFTVTVVEQADVTPVKTRLGVPASAYSCHTATIGGYAVEGHVPAEDIHRLLNERTAVAGIAVPGMPTGSPGMDGPKVPYTVVSFDRAGKLATFAER